MRKNEEGKLELFPYPKVDPCEILFIGETINIEEIKSGAYDINKEEVLIKALEDYDLNHIKKGYTVAIPYILNKAKTITNDKWAYHQNRLWQEINASGCKFVMPLGTIATQMLLADKQSKITKMIGNVIEKDGKKIIANYNPSSLYNKPSQYKIFRQIMETTSTLFTPTPTNPGTTSYTIIEDREQLKELINNIHYTDTIAVDIETNSLVVWDAEFWCMGIATDKNEVFVIPKEVYEKHSYLMQMFFDLPCKFVWHNGKYDVSVLYYEGYNVRIDEDTMLLHYCINENPGTHGLGMCSSIYLGANEYKSEMNSEFSNIKTEEDYLVYKEQLIKRVAIDCDYTLQLYNIFKPKVARNEKLLKLYNNILLPAVKLLTQVQFNGACMDLKYLQEKLPEYILREEELTKEIMDSMLPLWDEDGYRKKTKTKVKTLKFNPNSTKQLSYILYDVLKLKPIGRHKIGSTGKGVLESINNPPEFLTKILQLRAVKKERTTYIEAYLKAVDSANFIHCNFSVHSTVTGRLSCNAPNLQNVPSKNIAMRKAFIPRQRELKRMLMEVDYSSAELRVLAWISGDKDLEKAVVEGDLHSEVAKFIFGDHFTKEDRGIAKTVNFGIAYGRGAVDLAATFNRTKDECQRWIDDWASMYPKAWKYLLDCEKEVLNGDYLTTPYGRYRRFGLISKAMLKSLSNESKNFRIQSISSDNTLMAAIELEPLLNKEIGHTYIINLIHDSILIDCPGEPDVINKIARVVTSTMESIPKRYLDCNVPFHCDVDIGPNWGEVIPYDYNTETVKTKEGTIRYEDYWRGIYESTTN